MIKQQSIKIILSHFLLSICILSSCQKNQETNPALKVATVTTLAGGEGFGMADGTGKNSQFWGPSGITLSPDGTLYVTDIFSSRIRKVTPSGVVTTLAGSEDGYADGVGSQAKFYGPTGIAIAKDGNLYVADCYNGKIRKVSTTGVVETFAGTEAGYLDGPANQARFNGPRAIALGPDGTLYVAEVFGNKIRKISPTGMVSTLAGNPDPYISSQGGFKDGTGAEAEFDMPMGIAVTSDGIVYVADHNMSRIRKITPEGVVTTLNQGFGYGYVNGTTSEAKFNSPIGMTIGSDGILYICDAGNNRIRRIDAAGNVSTLAGSEKGFFDDIGEKAKFSFPQGITGSNNTFYVTDNYNNAIRKITLK